MKEMISCLYVDYSEKTKIKSNFPKTLANKEVN